MYFFYINMCNGTNMCYGKTCGVVQTCTFYIYMCNGIIVWSGIRCKIIRTRIMVQTCEMLNRRGVVKGVLW